LLGIATAVLIDKLPGLIRQLSLARGLIMAMGSELYYESKDIHTQCFNSVLKNISTGIRRTRRAQPF
jgi:hypothetical protein